MSSGSLYREENKLPPYTDVHCNSVNTNSFKLCSVGGTINSLDPDYLYTYKLTDQTLTSGVLTPLTNFDFSAGSYEFDIDLSTGIFTVPEDGFYYISSFVGFKANNTGSRKIVLSISSQNDYMCEIRNNSSGSMRLNIALPTFLNQNDTLHLEAFQSSGGNLDVDYIVMTIAKILP